MTRDAAQRSLGQFQGVTSRGVDDRTDLPPSSGGLSGSTDPLWALLRMSRLCPHDAAPQGLQVGDARREVSRYTSTLMCFRSLKPSRSRRRTKFLPTPGSP
jgi:hypothetical protein